MLDLVTFIQPRSATTASRGRGRAGREGLAPPSRRDPDLDRRELVELLAATWRAHSGTGVGPHPGSFTITEDDEKVTFTMNPCGSGQRLVRKGAYEAQGDGAHARGARLVLRPQGLPAVLHALQLHERVHADRVVGLSAVPSEPPEDFSPDPCTWYWYKDPDEIPERHWQRYGATKPGRQAI